MSVMRLNRRPPPLPLDAIFGSNWAPWITDAAAAAGCSLDYVAMPLLAVASVLIGNARWAAATPGWSEPPHLWICVVGDSGDGKSPGADCVLRDVLPELERRMMGDFPDRLREWRANDERLRATEKGWKEAVRAAQKKYEPAPLPPLEVASPEPQAPRLRQNDVTVERVATLLANAAPKGLLIVRDEMAGWLGGMNQYHDAGRAFWIEAYGGRPYRVERQKHPQPIEVPYLVVGAYGGTQPERLATMLREADDGLFARVLWAWPAPIPFRLGREKPGALWAIDALDRLRMLELEAPSEACGNPRPLVVRLADEAIPLMESFGRAMQAQQQAAGGLMRSAFGKARGLALRLSLVLELLWWCGADGMAVPPVTISVKAFLAAARLVAEYFMPMAERVYGDASANQRDRDAATLAKWIVKEKAKEVHVRHLQRVVRLHGLGTAEAIHAAAETLIEADWLRRPCSSGGRRPRMAYAVNPKVLFEAVANGLAADVSNAHTTAPDTTDINRAQIEHV
jgi:hypothetical protein